MSRRTVGRGVVGAVVITLALAGLALAHAASISISAPQSITAGAKYHYTVKGYFTCSKQTSGRSRYTCVDIASVDQFQGTLTCTKNLTRSGAKTIDSGTHDPKLREGHQKQGISTTDPGPFSAKIPATAPATAGHYTLCAYALNFPAGVVSKVATAHLTVTP